MTVARFENVDYRCEPSSRCSWRKSFDEIVLVEAQAAGDRLAVRPLHYLALADIALVALGLILRAFVAIFRMVGAPVTEHLLLVDCSAFAYRAFYGLPAMRRQADGEPVGAVLNFMSLIWRMLGAASVDNPTMGIACFDARGKTFRHRLDPNYKANRTPARSQELERQLPLMRPVAKVLGLTPMEKRGFEADDLIATLAARAREAKIRVTIVSSDKDFGQLVVDGAVEIVDPIARVNGRAPRIREAEIIKKFGVPPRLVPDVQGLAGDPVDNYRGVPGLGMERAAALIRRFGSHQAVLDNWNLCRWPTARLALKRHRKQAEKALKLATLRANVPLEADFEACRLRPIMRADLEAVVKKLDPGANVTALFGLDRQIWRVVDRVADPLAWWRWALENPGHGLPQAPQCGFYRRRLVRGGPYVPARIWREPYADPVTGEDTGQDVLRCDVNGQPKDAFEEFQWLFNRPIREEEFRFQEADFAHAKAFRPGDPKAKPEQRIDWNKVPL